MKNLVLIVLAGFGSLLSFHDAVEAAISNKLSLAMALTLVYTVSLFAVIYLSIDSTAKHFSRSEDDEDTHRD